MHYNKKIVLSIHNNFHTPESLTFLSTMQAFQKQLQWHTCDKTLNLAQDLSVATWQTIEPEKLRAQLLFFELAQHSLPHLMHLTVHTEASPASLVSPFSTHIPPHCPLWVVLSSKPEPWLYKSRNHDPGGREVFVTSVALASYSTYIASTI